MIKQPEHIRRYRRALFNRRDFEDKIIKSDPNDYYKDYIQQVLNWKIEEEEALKELILLGEIK